MLWPYWLVLAVLVLVVVVAWLCWTRDPTVLILVRHAEKAGGPNPVLTTSGSTRAQLLRRVVDEADVTAVYATEWCRTALTAEPSALMLDVPIRIQHDGDPEDRLEPCGLIGTTTRLDGSIVTPTDLISHALSSHRGQAVLIVGHSNTVPAMVEASGLPSPCPSYFPLDGTECHIPDEPPEDEYHHLFVLEVPRWFGSPRLVKARYGG